MNDITIELPWPPSTNRIWRNVVVNGRPQTLLSVDGRKPTPEELAFLDAGGFAG